MYGHSGDVLKQAGVCGHSGDVLKQAGVCVVTLVMY